MNSQNRKMKSIIYLLFLFFLALTLPLLTNAFSLPLEKSKAPIYPNDGPLSDDAGDTFETAMSIEQGGYTGRMPVGDNDDYFMFFVQSGATIYFTLVSGMGRTLDLYLYHPSTIEIVARTDSANKKTIEYETLSEGYWRIRIAKSSGSGVYAFSLSFTDFEEPPNPPLSTELVYFLIIGSIAIFLLASFFVFRYLKKNVKLSIQFGKKEKSEKDEGGEREEGAEPKSTKEKPEHYSPDNSLRPIPPERSVIEEKEPVEFTENLEGHMCMICMDFLRKNEEVVQCPHCLVVFHKDHLEGWIANHHNCPVCKGKLKNKNSNSNEP
ncbi:MAG: hypothetical protein GF308_07190 [Candidatus Heimdallarchaeota archaeon]|nr:hypothetical protein [Candidatus Heimdallarchaeota archaeon]